MENMALHHLCIQTSCYEASLSFYQAVLGAQVVLDTKDFHGRAHNTWLKCAGFMIELQTGKDGETLCPTDACHEGVVHFCLWVSDLDSLLARLLGAGIDSFLPKNGSIVYTVNGGQLMKLCAPEGTILEFRNSEIA